MELPVCNLADYEDRRSRVPFFGSEGVVRVGKDFDGIHTCRAQVSECEGQSEDGIGGRGSGGDATAIEGAAAGVETDVWPRA